jgi:hypothetical protein
VAPTHDTRVAGNVADLYHRAMWRVQRVCLPAALSACMFVGFGCGSSPDMHVGAQLQPWNSSVGMIVPTSIPAASTLTVKGQHIYGVSFVTRTFGHTRLWRLDAATGEVLQGPELGTQSGLLWLEGDSLMLSSQEAKGLGHVTRLYTFDSRTLEPLGSDELEMPAVRAGSGLLLKDLWAVAVLGGATHKPGHKFEVPQEEHRFFGAEARGDNLYVLGTFSGRLLRVDRASGKILATGRVGDELTSPLSWAAIAGVHASQSYIGPCLDGQGRVWAYERVDSGTSIVRCDEATCGPIERWKVPVMDFWCPQSMQWFDGAFWISYGALVTRLEPPFSEAKTLDFHEPGQLVQADGKLWFISGHHLWRFDLATAGTGATTASRP